MGISFKELRGYDKPGRHGKRPVCAVPKTFKGPLSETCIDGRGGIKGVGKKEVKIGW